MHDPMTVAFTIHRPWPQRDKMHDAKPGKPRWSIRLHHTCGSYCGTNRAAHEASNPFPWWRTGSYSAFWTLAGRGFYWPSLITIWHVEPDGRDSGEVCKRHGRWRWHIHHWRVQVHPIQALRRRLLTRCEWCGGRSRKGDAVNVSHQWDRKPGPWWRGERGLFHVDCSSIESAHRACLCADPVLLSKVGEWAYGHCARCSKFRGWKTPSARLDRLRMLAAIPEGRRDPAVYARVCELAKAERQASDTEEMP